MSNTQRQIWRLVFSVIVFYDKRSLKLRRIKSDKVCLLSILTFLFPPKLETVLFYKKKSRKKAEKTSEKQR